LLAIITGTTPYELCRHFFLL